jgi:glycosyltransferase involved in cell wall biosynthesis
MGLGGNFLTQRLILERLPRAQFDPVVVTPVEGIALEEFRKMGVECMVISPPGRLDRYGGATLRIGILGRLKAAVDLLRYNLQLAHILRERQIDVVYANCVRAEMSIGLAARLAGVPSLLYIKGELNNPVIDRLSFLLASKILFFCAQNRDDKYPGIIRSCRKKIDILEIGLDSSVIGEVERRDKAALRDELGIDPCCTNVIVLGQLYRPKGQHLVLEALSKIVADYPETRLYLLGDHVIDEYRPYKLELDRMIEKYRLKKYVHFTGWRRDALDVVALMDIVIHPSLSEGFGRAVLESMALGKPVIASRVGGLRQAIQDGKNGFLIHPGDVAAIEQRWRELLADPELRLRLGKEARKTVFAEYLIDDKVCRLADIWTEMARGRG